MPTIIEILSDEKSTFAYGVVLQPTLLTGPPAPVDLQPTTYNEAAPAKPAIIAFPEEPGIHSGAGTSSATSTAAATGTALISRAGNANATSTATGESIVATPGAGTANATSTAIGASPTGSTLLLHCDGTSGAQVFTDSASAPHTVTPNGDVETDTGQKQFGTASAAFFGADWLALDNAADLAFGTGAFTVDFWLRLGDTTEFYYLYDGRPAGGTDGAYPTVYVSDNDKLKFYANGADQITGTTTLAAGTWYHVALTRSGTTTRLFLNGSQEGSTSDSRNYAAGGTGTPRFGASADSASGLFGWMDEIRILKGTAAWTANFTPPTSAYTS